VYQSLSKLHDTSRKKNHGWIKMSYNPYIHTTVLFRHRFLFFFLMPKWNILTIKERSKPFTTRPARAVGVPGNTSKCGCRIYVGFWCQKQISHPCMWKTCTKQNCIPKVHEMWSITSKHVLLIFITVSRPVPLEEQTVQWSWASLRYES